MSRQDEIQSLIDQHQKNLHTYLDQAAKYGPLDVPLNVSNSVNATQGELKKLWIQLGDIEVSEGNVKNAIAAYGHALRFDPDDAVLNDKLQKQYDLVAGLYRATMAFHNSENWARAAEDWQKLIQWGFDTYEGHNIRTLLDAANMGLMEKIKQEKRQELLKQGLQATKTQDWASSVSAFEQLLAEGVVNLEGNRIEKLWGDSLCKWAVSAHQAKDWVIAEKNWQKLRNKGIKKCGGRDVADWLIEAHTERVKTENRKLLWAGGIGFGIILLLIVGILIWWSEQLGSADDESTPTPAVSISTPTLLPEPPTSTPTIKQPDPDISPTFTPTMSPVPPTNRPTNAPTPTLTPPPTETPTSTSSPTLTRTSTPTDTYGSTPTFAPTLRVDAELGESYIIQSGDWLSAIAAEKYDAPLAYEAIVFYNNQLVSQGDATYTIYIEDPGRIGVGWVIYLPSQEQVDEFRAMGPILPEINPGSVTDDIIMEGSSTVFLLSERMKERFQEDGFNGTITNTLSSTGVGFEKFCGEGTTDIANASRVINENEQQRCQRIGREPVEFQVGVDALTIVVNSQNNFVNDVTFDELKLIFSTAISWSQVRAVWPPEPIMHFIPDEQSGTFDYFVEKVFNGDEQSILSATNVITSEDDTLIVQGVENNPYAIGFFGYAYYKTEQDRLKALSVNGVEPRPETVHNETYPLARPLFIYSAPIVMNEKPQVANFINYYLTHVNEEIEDAGYFPVASDDLNVSKQTWLDTTP